MSLRSRHIQGHSLSSSPVLGVVVRAQTYKNLLYLALTFPLGLFYFTLLVAGVPLGVRLLSVVVGLPVLIGVLVVSDRLLVFERWLACRLLDRSIPLDRDTEADDWRDYVRQPITDLGTWVGIAYLAAKFVVGVVTFVVLTVLFVLVASLLLAPLYYDTTSIGFYLTGPVDFSLSYVVQFWDGAAVITLPFTITSWQVTTLREALAVSAGGAVLGILSLHLCNLLARVQGWLTTVAIRPRPVDVELPFYSNN
ncbi:histidine kinase [Halomicrobium mukohataei]|uniref:Histidine kinase n=1 Tax=Halomicrobium mukohataei TaxID=57705 RepID=A0A847UII1_9EURY|nr:sensor domain-containing protein [Halomicrobium mukohataei]NLV11121.1 histidine kinase [Halomicrobium mukohataei]